SVDRRDRSIHGRNHRLWGDAQPRARGREPRRKALVGAGQIGGRQPAAVKLGSAQQLLIVRPILAGTLWREAARAPMRLFRVGASVVALILGCDGTPREAPVERPPVPAVPDTEPAPSAPPPPSAPLPPNFEAESATSATVRIVAIHGEHWTACGVIHEVGAIEVEVLEVGEPRPRMILFVSCPADSGHRELLEDGAVLRVTLFAKRQRWPTPPASRTLPAELPRRYVDTLARP